MPVFLARSSFPGHSPAAFPGTSRSQQDPGTRRAHEALQAVERHSWVGEYSWAVPLGDRSAWPGTGAAHGFSTAVSSLLACSQQTEPVNHKLQMFFLVVPGSDQIS